MDPLIAAEAGKARQRQKAAKQKRSGFSRMVKVGKNEFWEPWSPRLDATRRVVRVHADRASAIAIHRLSPEGINDPSAARAKVSRSKEYTAEQMAAMKDYRCTLDPSKIVPLSTFEPDRNWVWEAIDPEGNKALEVEYEDWRPGDSLHLLRKGVRTVYILQRPSPDGSEMFYIDARYAPIGREEMELAELPLQTHDPQTAFWSAEGAITLSETCDFCANAALPHILPSPDWKTFPRPRETTVAVGFQDLTWSQVTWGEPDAQGRRKASTTPLDFKRNPVHGVPKEEGVYIRGAVGLLRVWFDDTAAKATTWESFKAVNAELRSTCISCIPRDATPVAVGSTDHVLTYSRVYCPHCDATHIYTEEREGETYHHEMDSAWLSNNRGKVNAILVDLLSCHHCGHFGMPQADATCSTCDNPEAATTDHVLLDAVPTMNGKARVHTFSVYKPPKGGAPIFFKTDKDWQEISLVAADGAPVTEVVNWEKTLADRPEILNDLKDHRDYTLLTPEEQSKLMGSTTGIAGHGIR